MEQNIQYVKVVLNVKNINTESETKLNVIWNNSEEVTYMPIVDIDTQHNLMSI